MVSWDWVSPPVEIDSDVPPDMALLKSTNLRSGSLPADTRGMTNGGASAAANLRLLWRLYVRGAPSRRRSALSFSSSCLCSSALASFYGLTAAVEVLLRILAESDSHLFRDVSKDELGGRLREHVRAKEEVKRIQSVPLVIGQFLEAVDQNTGIVGSTTCSNYYVRILSTIDRELLKPSASVALHKHSNALVDVLPPEADSSSSMLGADEKPDVGYSDIGRILSVQE